MLERLLIVFLSYPLLGQSCSCAFFSSDRYETLREGICFGTGTGEVYSGVVVGATCSCIVRENRVDCREYSYSEDNGTYSAEVITRVQTDFITTSLKTCTQVEDILGAESDVTLQRNGSEVVVENGTERYGLFCPFNDRDASFYEISVCVYSVRVTEVFIGRYNVGDLITSSGPLALPHCGVEGRILRLNTEYLVGVGGFCSRVLRDWEPLSAYSESDLNQLRQLAEEKQRNEDEDIEDCFRRILPSSTVPAPTPTITTTAPTTALGHQLRSEVMAVVAAGIIYWVIK